MLKLMAFIVFQVFLLRRNLIFRIQKQILLCFYVFTNLFIIFLFSYKNRLQSKLLTILKISFSKMQKQKHASQSTNYRYKKANRIKDLSTFCQFRNEYENIIDENKIAQLKSVFPHGICGKNQRGHLVVVDKVGSIKMSDVNKILDEEEIIAYFNQRLLNISERILGEKDQIIWVMDLHGKIMQLASKKLLTLVIKIIKSLLTYFPNILYRMYLVNTPMLFDTIWSKLSNDIPEQTQQKIVILSDQIQGLYEQISPEQLPDFLGGDLQEEMFLRDCCINQNDKQVLKQNNQQLNKDQEEDEEEQQEFDFASLKQALSGMKMGGLQSVNQTPLNTEADDS